jgi:hypothetical protein
MKNLSSLTKVHQSPGVLFNQVDDDLVMMDVNSGNYFGINPVGAEIWNKMEEPVTIQEIINQLLAEYDIDEEICRRETLAFVQQTLERGFVKVLDEKR